MLSDLEKQVILVLQRDLEIEPRPFLDLAAHLGLEEEVVLAAIRGLSLEEVAAHTWANTLAVFGLTEEAVLGPYPAADS